jgi:hypothetical protein
VSQSPGLLPLSSAFLSRTRTQIVQSKITLRSHRQKDMAEQGVNVGVLDVKVPVVVPGRVSEYEMDLPGKPGRGFGEISGDDRRIRPGW